MSDRHNKELEMHRRENGSVSVTNVAWNDDHGYEVSHSLVQITPNIVDMENIAKETHIIDRMRIGA